MSFYDFFLYEKFKTLADGYQWTIEFLVGWKKFMGSFLEIRILYQISQHSQGRMALKFWLKARDVAIDLKGLRGSPTPPSTDDIHLQTSDVKLFTDALFTNTSTLTKVLIWLKTENQFLSSLSLTSPLSPQIKFLSSQLSPNSVSLSYLLEYILRDYLPHKKRYIDNLSQPKQCHSLIGSQNSIQLKAIKGKFDRENGDFCRGKDGGKLWKAIKVMNREMEEKRVGLSRVLG
jgi:hypothetical protein